MHCVVAWMFELSLWTGKLGSFPLECANRRCRIREYHAKIRYIVEPLNNLVAACIFHPARGVYSGGVVCVVCVSIVQLLSRVNAPRARTFSPKDEGHLFRRAIYLHATPQSLTLSCAMLHRSFWLFAAMLYFCHLYFDVLRIYLFFWETICFCLYQLLGKKKNSQFLFVTRINI